MSIVIRQHVTRKQQAELKAFLDAGILDKALAARVIKTCKGRVRAEEKREELRTEVLGLDQAKWEKRFPGCGTELVELLRPFGPGWQPELKPPDPKLAGLARKAVFWKDYGRVWTVKVADFDSAMADVAIRINDSLHKALWHRLGAMLRIRPKTATSLLAKKLRKEYGFMRTTPAPWAKDLFWQPVFHACSLILVEHPAEAARFVPLFYLWLLGNFPLGFDKHGDLLVMVAD